MDHTIESTLHQACIDLPTRTIPGHTTTTFYPKTPIQRRFQKPEIPLAAIHYSPTTSLSTSTAQALQANLKEAHLTYNGLPTPLMPDEILFNIDTGASVTTITNAVTHFIYPPRLAQHTQLKGIAAGLTVMGIGTAIYTFKGDIAETTKCEGDGFNSTSPTGTLTCQGHKITVAYHHLTGLAVIQTAPGVSSYIS
jgi:hypothetical protein